MGGGIFGSYAALLYAKMGYSVVLIEQDGDLLNRASSINQARIHTGLHYPRSFLTARNSLKYFMQFQERFPEAVFEFKQIYGISEYNSKTNISQFRDFTQRLNVPVREINPDNYFISGTVSGAFEVLEPTFDAEILRKQLKDEMKELKNIHFEFGSPLAQSEKIGANYALSLASGKSLKCKEILVASYAGTNKVRSILGLQKLSLSYELTEVILGRTTGSLKGLGFTIMDGPFWSLMPFGNSGFSSLTSVGYTPILSNSSEPSFSCQRRRLDCNPSQLKNCTNCEFRPKTMQNHTLQQMRKHLLADNNFVPEKNYLTIKTILKTTEVDDARPTVIHRESNEKITTVFSGKLSTIFDLEKELS